MNIVNDILAGTFAWNPADWLLGVWDDDEEEEDAGEASADKSGDDSEEVPEEVDWVRTLSLIFWTGLASFRLQQSISSLFHLVRFWDIKHERFHVLLRDLRSACAASTTSWSSAVRVFPSLASRPLFVRELQLVERAGIKAGALTSRQRRNWASTIASVQDSVGPMEAEMFIFRRLFGDLGESREDRGVRSRRERIRRKFLKDRKLQAASAAVDVAVVGSSGVKAGGTSRSRLYFFR
ncbi:hypothetical protein BC829DRAFT_416696 [Chytridium lagenaria]|nr:hypothetical protein BC829DRAFT_416696 [Chytridium lagenaria]